MIILTIRTDKPDAEIGVYDNHAQLGYEVWQAHRQLAETLNQKIETMLTQRAIGYADLQGVVVYRGPGSFTGLRIGLSVANALAHSLGIPIVAQTGTWLEEGISRLMKGESDMIALPEYGSPVNVTSPRK